MARAIGLSLGMENFYSCFKSIHTVLQARVMERFWYVLPYEEPLFGSFPILFAGAFILTSISSSISVCARPNDSKFFLLLAQAVVTNFSVRACHGKKSSTSLFAQNGSRDKRRKHMMGKTAID